MVVWSCLPVDGEAAGEQIGPSEVVLCCRRSGACPRGAVPLTGLELNTAVTDAVVGVQLTRRQSRTLLMWGELSGSVTELL